MKILVANQKGGVGKSTLAVCLAAYAAKLDRTLLLDLDPQGTSTLWAKVRQHDQPDRPTVDFKHVKKQHDMSNDIFLDSIDSMSTEYKYVFLDAGGRDGFEMRAGMLLCDRLLIPIRAAQADAWALEDMLDLIKKCNDFRETPVDVRIVMNAVRTGFTPKRVLEIKKFVRDKLGLNLAQFMILERTCFDECMSEGLGVHELPETKSQIAAVNDIRDLLNWLVMKA